MIPGLKPEGEPKFFDQEILDDLLVESWALAEKINRGLRNLKKPLVAGRRGNKKPQAK